MQEGNTWSVQVPGAGRLLGVPGIRLLAGIQHKVCRRNPNAFWHQYLATGKQLRGLPKEFLPSKELGFLT